MGMKKTIMTMLWRVQQAQMMISILFWSLTLTGIFYPYIRVRILNDLVGPSHVFLGMAMIFLFVVGLIVLFGYLYDRLKFWKEQVMVAQERNPFSYGTKMTPIQITLFKAILSGDGPERERAIRLIEDNERDPQVSRIMDEINQKYWDD
jgi:hypothetical protein